MNGPARRFPKRPTSCHSSTRRLWTACAGALALLVLDAAGANAQSASGSPGCSAPLGRLQAVASARPHLADGHAQLGRCYLALGRTDIAHLSLERAAEIDPTPDRQLEVAVALYHARKLDEADSILTRLAEAIPDRADVHFYRGLILLERGEQAAAAARLDHARRLSPGRVEPVASYFAGVSYANAGDLERAREALQRIARDWDGTQWGKAAAAEIARLDGTRDWNYWLEAEVGIQYDSNVSLNGRSVTPREISDTGDFRTSHTVRGGTEVAGDGWYAGLSASYNGTVYFDENAFDLKYPSVTAYAYRRIGSASGIRFQADGGRAWVGNDPFVVTYDSTLALSHDWGAAYGSSELFSDFLFRNYQRPNFDVPGPGGGVNAGVCPPGANATLQQCGPAALDEAARRDRDGIGFRAGLAHLVPVPDPLTEVRFLAAFERFVSEGTEYDYNGIEAGLRARFDIDFGLTGEIGSTYRAFWFEHPSTYPDAIPSPVDFGAPVGVVSFPYALSNDDRRDHTLDVSARIERELLYDLAVSLRYGFERRFSNTKVFDFSRHVGGVYLTWRPDWTE